MHQTAILNEISSSFRHADFYFFKAILSLMSPIFRHVHATLKQVSIRRIVCICHSHSWEQRNPWNSSSTLLSCRHTNLPQLGWCKRCHRSSQKVCHASGPQPCSQPRDVTLPTHFLTASHITPGVIPMWWLHSSPPIVASFWWENMK